MTESNLLDVFQLGIHTHIEGAKFESAILYGPPGSGKTHFALSISEVEKYSPVLVVDTENSVSGVIDNFRQRDMDNPQDIAFDEAKGGGIVDVIRPADQWGAKAYENTLALLEEVIAGNTIYNTVVIDVADVLQKWGLAYHDDPKNSFAKWDMIDNDLTSSPLEGEGGKRSTGLFHRLKASGVFTVLVIHEKKETPEGAEGVVTSDFQWQGQGKGKLGGIPDAVFYFKRTAAGKKATTKMYTQSTARFLAKNRFQLEHEYSDPSFAEVLQDAKRKGKN